MAPPRKLGTWEVAALELGLDPGELRRKVTRLRSKEAGKFAVSTVEMQAVYGWDTDDMAWSLVSAIQHGRCRGPRCRRVYFRDLPLDLVTGDILNPCDPPLFCVNFAWTCKKDNSGDGPRPLTQRGAELVRVRRMALVVPDEPAQLTLF